MPVGPTPGGPSATRLAPSPGIAGLRVTLAVHGGSAGRRMLLRLRPGFVLGLHRRGGNSAVVEPPQHTTIFAATTRRRSAAHHSRRAGIADVAAPQAATRRQEVDGESERPEYQPRDQRVRGARVRLRLERPARPDDLELQPDVPLAARERQLAAHDRQPSGLVPVRELDRERASPARLSPLRYTAPSINIRGAAPDSAVTTSTGTDDSGAPRSSSTGRHPAEHGPNSLTGFCPQRWFVGSGPDGRHSKGRPPRGQMRLRPCHRAPARRLNRARDRANGTGRPSDIRPPESMAPTRPEARAESRAIVGG